MPQGYLKTINIRVIPFGLSIFQDNGIDCANGRSFWRKLVDDYKDSDVTIFSVFSALISLRSPRFPSPRVAKQTE